MSCILLIPQTYLQSMYRTVPAGIECTTSSALSAVRRPFDCMGTYQTYTLMGFSSGGSAAIMLLVQQTLSTSTGSCCAKLVPSNSKVSDVLNRLS